MTKMQLSNTRHFQTREGNQAGTIPKRNAMSVTTPYKNGNNFRTMDRREPALLVHIAKYDLWYQS